MVVPLLHLACTGIASLTNYITNKVAKDHFKTQNCVRMGRRICFPAVLNSRKAKGEVFSTSGNSPRYLQLAVKRLDQVRSRTALLKVCHHFLPLLHYTWCPGIGLSIFCMVIACIACSCLSFHSYIIMCSWAKYSLIPKRYQRVQTFCCE